MVKPGGVLIEHGSIRMGRIIVVMLCIAIKLSETLLASGNDPNAAGLDSKPQTSFRLTPVRVPMNCFGGVKAGFTLRLEGVTEIVQLDWELTRDHRLLHKGRLNVRLSTEHPVESTFFIELPKVNEGVVIDGNLRIRVHNDEGTQYSMLEFPVWIFPENPFGNQQHAYRGWEIEIIDPLDQLESRLSALGFTKSLGEETKPAGSLLVVGPMKTWEPDVRQRIATALACQWRVLCFGIKQGKLEIPISSELDLFDPNFPIVVRSSNVAAMLDARLNVPYHAFCGRAKCLSIPGESTEIDVDAKAPGWGFLALCRSQPQNNFQLRTGDRGSTNGDSPAIFIYCGLDVTVDWESSPTPRFLVASALAELTQCLPGSRAHLTNGQR